MLSFLRPEDGSRCSGYSGARKTCHIMWYGVIKVLRYCFIISDPYLGEPKEFLPRSSVPIHTVLTIQYIIHSDNPSLLFRHISM